MKTHTVRNKGKNNPIITFTPEFFKKVKTCCPEAVSLTICWLLKSYKELSGNSPSLDYEQMSELITHFGMNEDGSWVSMLANSEFPVFQIEKMFVSGILGSCSLDAEQVLDIAQGFYSAFEKRKTDE